MRSPYHRRVLAIALLFLTTALLPVAGRCDPPTDDHGRHPAQLLRNPDGSLKRGIFNQYYTSNWSGYVQTSGPYTSASATWRVPGASWDGASTGTSTYQYDSIWVGIGGWGESTLIQLGTEQYVNASGTVWNNAWFELYPASPVSIPYSVRPGDTITTSLECVANCSPGATQSWTLTMANATAGWTWTRTVSYASSLRSAEWVVEAPWSGGVLPLLDYGQADFGPVLANGSIPTLLLSSNGVIMKDPYGETSNPSAPTDGGGFSACWGAAGALTPCPSGSSTGTSPSVKISASPSSITLGQSSILNWSSNSADSCQGTGFDASGTSGSATVAPSVTTTYGITCTGNGGSAASSATVTVKSVKAACQGNGAKKC